MSDPKYLTYTPWQGDWNNTRMCFETALILAHISRRCLVLPQSYRREHEPQVEGGRFRPLHPDEYFDLQSLKTIVPWIEYEEYDRLTTARQQADRVDLAIQNGTAVFCYPNKPALHTPEDRRLRDFAASRRCFLEITPEMESCGTLNLANGTLEHFYSFFFFLDAAKELECKRLIRDHIRYRSIIDFTASRIAASIGDYCALHVRRNDFFGLYPEQNISIDRMLGNVLMRIPAKSQMYIASDERDRVFFHELSKYYRLWFIEDFAKLLPDDLSPGRVACVEQMICAFARVFVGTRFSTFSAYITRLRGYRGAADQNTYFTDGLPGSEVDSHGSPPFSWINWLKMGYPMWGREFREGWDFNGLAGPDCSAEASVLSSNSQSADGPAA